jgi:hypothetical protein
MIATSSRIATFLVPGQFLSAIVKIRKHYLVRLEIEVDSIMRDVVS